MDFPGLITIAPDDRERAERAIVLLGDSFMEEMWFSTWLEALNAAGIDEKRKRALLHAVFADDVEAFAPYGAIHMLEDMTAAVGGYLFSELRGETLTSIEGKQAGRHFLAEASGEEVALLERREREMKPISSFDWAREHAQGDHINFFAWAVDPNARGKGSLRRALEPFFAYADERNLNCYLECYADRLQSMYEHLGFELIDELHADGFNIYERRMVRYPKSAAAR